MTTAHTMAFGTCAALLLGLAPPAAAGPERDIKSRATLFKTVRYFDGTALRTGNVLVEGDRVASVNWQGDLATVLVVNGAGKTLLPGFIDSHTHADNHQALRTAVLHGVTTELDMFADPRLVRSEKQAQLEGRADDVADLRSAGILATAPGGHGTEYGFPIPTITKPEEADAFVDARLAEGSDYIKIVYDDGRWLGVSVPTLSKAAVAALVQAAHRRQRLAVAHVGTLHGARDAVEAGVDGLEHLFVDAPPDAEFAPLLAKRGVFVVPTLVTLRHVRDHGLSYQYAIDTVRALRAAHVPLLAGTDVDPAADHGVALHLELELLVSAGLTPTEALAAATSVPARCFHLDDRGRITPGSRADLLLVRGDPTADISSTRYVVGVWKRGRKVDRSK